MVNAAFTVEDGIARIELQRPEALNAVEMPTKRAIIERVRDYRDDDSVRVVVFQSQGDSFCAGGDLQEVVEGDYALEPFTDSWEELFEAMMDLGKPTVARIDGYTLGGGFDLMLHTDIPIAAEDAKLGQPEVGLGIVNHFSPPMLQVKVGLTKTLDMMLTGEMISGEEAARLGLVARSVPAEDLDEALDSAEDAADETGNLDFRRVSSHDLRRAWANHLLVEEGVSPRIVMALGGWSSYDAIEPYLAAPTEDNIIDSMQAVSL